MGILNDINSLDILYQLFHGKNLRQVASIISKAYIAVESEVDLSDQSNGLSKNVIALGRLAVKEAEIHGSTPKKVNL